MSAHFDAFRLSACNEAQLESEFIGPLLAQLGRFKVPQQTLIVQGKPDWCLLLAEGQDAVFITGKADLDKNPHHQLQDYLSSLRVRFRLFEMLEEGAQNIDIPLFNGVLFNPARAPLLLTAKIFDNATLRLILEKLLNKTSRGTTLLDTRRDFKNKSTRSSPKTPCS